MSKLSLIPTPIGNLDDITIRALNTLKSVDLILAEDTRHSAKLLAHYGITKPLESYHMHNEHQKTPQLIKRLKQNHLHIGLITDAGTPGISDPGFMLVRACVEAGIQVECLPGATAFVPALAASGLPCEKFVFEGFLPPKKGRETKLRHIAESDYTTIFYESPHKIEKTLEKLKELCEENRRIVVAKEISKIHETFYRGTISKVLHKLQETAIKGEYVVVLEGIKKKPAKAGSSTQ